MSVASIPEIESRILSGQPIKFAELKKVCDHYFGEPRIKGSHHIYKMPWAGNPRINIQKFGKDAKAYQIRQVAAALVKLHGAF